MKEPVWITREVVLATQEELLSRFVTAMVAMQGAEISMKSMMHRPTRGL